MHIDAQSKPSQVWRAMRWCSAAVLLLAPLVAMQFTDELRWSVGDFITLALLLAGAGLAYEFAATRSSMFAYRVGAVLAILVALLLVWLNLAVGIIGSEDNPANWMFAAVLAIGVGGAIIVHGRAWGMAWVMVMTAIVQLIVGIVALVGDLAEGSASGVTPVIALTLFFTLAWLSSAALFRKASREG